MDGRNAPESAGMTEAEPVVGRRKKTKEEKEKDKERKAHEKEEGKRRKDDEKRTKRKSKEKVAVALEADIPTSEDRRNKMVPTA